MSYGRAIVPVLLLASLSSCRAPEASSEAAVPDGVRVTVEINGGEGAPITSETLRATPPSFHDADHRAWLLKTVLPATAVRPGTELEVEEEDGTRTIFARIGAPEENEPALMVNRKGQVLIVLIDPDNPFPAFHGRGGNRGQGGRANRVRGVVGLRLTSE